MFWLAAVAAVSLAPSAEAGSTSLWRVRSGTATMYLLGSVHLMRPDAYPLPVVVETAFEASRVTVFEVDLGAESSVEAALTALSAGSLPEGQRLRDVISDETWRLASSRASEAGLDIGSMDRMRPWMVATSIALAELQEAGYSPADGVDRYFHRRAVDGGKKVLGLETIEFQLGLMAGLTREQDEAFLRQTLLDVDTVIPVVAELVDHWRHGRTGEVAAILSEGYREYPELFRRLVSERNATWVGQLEDLLEGHGPVFVVVGTLHLVGQDGVVELLRARGYSVEQL